MLVVPVAVLRATLGRACEIAYDTIDFGCHIGPIENLSECIKHLTLAGVSGRWQVVRHHYYAFPER